MNKITKENNKEIDNNDEKKREIASLPQKIDEKYLYICKSVFNAYEYKKMAKYFPKGTYWIFVLNGVCLNLLFTTVFTLMYKNILVTVLFFIGYQLYLMLFYKIGLEECCEKHYNSLVKKGLPVETHFETEFYNDYFIRKTANSSAIYQYSDMVKSIETKTHFYFDYPQRNKIVIIQKDKCDSELIDFIRKKVTT